MKYLSKLIILISVLTIGNAFAQKSEKQLFSERFSSVDVNKVVKLENSFGNISITSWDQKDVDVKVTLLTEGYDEKDIAKMMESVTINSNQTRDVISVSTALKNKKIQITGNRKFEINYEIKLPKIQALDMAQEFGNIFMQDHTGAVTIHLEYGNLTAGKLNALTLKHEFGKGEIESIEEGELSLSYVDKINLNSAGNLKINSEFSKVFIGDMNALTIDSEYGGITLAELNSLMVNMEFSSLEVDKVNSSFECMAEYASGTIDVKAIGNKLDKFVLDIEFSKAEIQLNENQSVAFTSTHSFGNLETINCDATFTKRINDDFEKRYEGIIGSDTAPITTMILSSSYGNIKIRKK